MGLGNGTTGEADVQMKDFTTGRNRGVGRKRALLWMDEQRKRYQSLYNITHTGIEEGVQTCCTIQHE